MAIRLTNKRTWGANKWISLKVFSDYIQFLDLETDLGKEVLFLNKVSIDFLDLTELDNESMVIFKKTLNQVIKYNEEKKGSDMAQSSYYPMYYGKLMELKQMLEQIYKEDTDNEEG